MYFPFESGERRKPEYEPHYHEFEGILKEIIWDPENFTITEDQKQFYSEQELTLIYQLRDRIMEMNREGSK